jgi:hypothetical protein
MEPYGLCNKIGQSFVVDIAFPANNKTVIICNDILITLRTLT